MAYLDLDLLFNRSPMIVPRRKHTQGSVDIRVALPVYSCFSTDIERVDHR